MARKLKSASRVLQNTTNDQKNEAWKALQKFNELKPQLTNFARSITRNPKVQVHATSSGPYSQGNQIYIRPPLALGRNYQHNRRDCGRRGSDGRQVCEACRVRETIDFYLNHEIGHVWLGSQVAPNDDDFDILTDMIMEWHPIDACSHGNELVSYLRGEPFIIGACSIFSMYLNFIWNGLEDARVNEGMFEARPGLRKIFDVNLDRMMTEGVERTSGEFVTWQDAPADPQFMVGLSVMACGYDVADSFHPEVIEALKDERLVEICERSRYARSAHEITALSIQAFVVAQELGFCVVPKCEVKPEQDEDKNDGQPDKPEGLSNPGEQEGGTGAGKGSAEGQGSKGESQSEGSGTASDVSDETGSGGNKEDESGGESSTSNSAPADGPGIHSDDSEGSDDQSGSTGSESAATEGDDSGGSDSSDETDGVGGGWSDREDDSTDGDGTDGDEPQSATGTSGSVDDGEDESGFEGGQSISDTTDGIGDGDVSDGTDTSRDSDAPVETGESGDCQQDDSESRRGDDIVESDEEASGEIDDGPDDDSDLDEPKNPWDVKAPEHDFGPLPDPGTIEDIEKALAPMLMHGLDDEPGMLEGMLGEELKKVLEDVIDEESEAFTVAAPLLKVAIMQVVYFDNPSMTVAGVDVAKFPSPHLNWSPGDWKECSPSERIVGAAVLHARLAFEANRRSGLERNKTSGRVDTRVLAKRAPIGDPRLFGKKTQPKKRSYFVIITGDCSASTHSYERNAKIRRMMMAQGDILHRIGVPFVMMGHSAASARMDKFQTDRGSDYWMYVLPIKSENEGWGPTTKSRLAGMSPISENLDGHTLEYCRKLADKSQATDVIIIYYTDGAMPAANYNEEREILERETALCKRKGYHLLGVGINTDSPKEYGMNTVQVDSDEDVILVIKQLEEELTK